MQRGLVMTLAASEKSALERAARSEMLENADSAIVAAKPTNKAGQPAAEPVERRAEAKGNASQQSTRRAQDRASVSQALERIRQAARQRKKERFTSLFHHLSIDLLRLAFFALKREAAPGVDGLTWRDYEADLDRRIEDLHARVHRGAYRALPSRRRHIPKADGPAAPVRGCGPGRQNCPGGGMHASLGPVGPRPGSRGHRPWLGRSGRERLWSWRRRSATNCELSS